MKIQTEPYMPRYNNEFRKTGFRNRKAMNGECADELTPVMLLM